MEDQIIDPDMPINDETAEKVQAEARKNFSLADRLTGAKQRVTKVLIYTDLDDVDIYNRLNREVQDLVDAMGRMDLGKKEQAELHAQMLEQHNELEPKVEEAKAAMLKGALAFTLRAYPNIAVKVARRDARKEFVNKATGSLNEGVEQVQVNEWIDMRLLSDSIVEIKDSSGELVELGIDRKELGMLLSNMLPPTQWQRLYDAFITLTLSDGIAQAATDDPGF